MGTMKVSIPATCGDPYRLRKCGRLYTLSRRNSQGRDNAIVMGKADVIAICNQLIDLLETGTTNE
jgi:hypothetical protein